MSPPLQILYLEDNLKDFELVQAHLEKEGLNCDIKVVESREDFTAALDKNQFDMIFADYNLPSFDGITALSLTRQKYPDIPFILISGSVGEDIAVDALKKGATDYILKQNLVRLTPAVNRAMKEYVEKLKHKKTEEELHRLASFPKLNPNPIIEKKILGPVTYVNPAAHTQFRKLVIGSYHHPILEEIDAIALELEHHNKGLAIREIEINDKIYEQQISTVSGRQLIHIYMTDITERKHIDMMKDEIISKVSHELRTPLTIINGAIDNLESQLFGKLNQEQLKLIRASKNNSYRLARIIDNLLDLSKLESGTMQGCHQRINLIHLISFAVKNFQSQIETRNLTVKLDFQDGFPPVLADNDLTLQVVNNVIDNAITYAQHQIVIHGTVMEGKMMAVQISISDDGHGIPEGKEEELFQKFVQLDRPDGGSGYKGTGLGLAICREIMRQQEGNIWAENNPDGGVCIHFTLPQYQDKEKSVKKISKEKKRRGIRLVG